MVDGLWSMVGPTVMLKVALTGGIATGKSYVLARLKDRGVATIDADDIVHAALGAGTETTKAIAQRFGSAFLKPDGSVHRTLLGAKVFEDPETRQQIEAIVHPVVWDTINEWYAKLERPIGVASISLLYETNHQGDFDFVVVTLCPPEVQLQRILERDRMSEAQARQRIAAQMPAEEKARRANFVILTGGTMLATDRQVDDLLETLSSPQLS
jgi:dephospho-CoA kinase